MESSSLGGGRGASFFTEPDGTVDDTGREVRLYGVSPGLVALEGFWQNGTSPAVSYSALVVPLATVPFRVEIAHGLTLKSNTTVDQAVQMIKSANVYLRQAGVELTPDADGRAGYFQNGISATPTATPGYFNVQGLPDEDIKNVLGEFTNGLAVENAVPNVVNIVYVQSFVDAETSGVAVYHPGNMNLNVGAPVVPDIADLSIEALSGTDGEFVVGSGPMAENMYVEGARPNKDAAQPSLYGMVLSDIAHGATITHEMGHVFGLAHRTDTDVFGPDGGNIGLPWDGLPSDATNLMDYYGKNQYFDLIQMLYLRGSEILPFSTRDI